MAVSLKQQQQLIERLKQGDTLRAACRAVDIPEPNKVIDLTRTDEAFAAQYAQARLDGYQQMADDLLDVADDREHDSNSRRIAVDTRKWLLSKCLPKIYGDRITLDGKLTSKADDLTDEQLQAIIAAKQAK
jgi:hypothetical protein